MTTTRVRGVAELATFLPYFLGLKLDYDFVVVLLDDRGRVSASLRLDPPPTARAGWYDLAPALRRTRPSAAGVLTYGVPAGDALDDALFALVAEVEAAGVEVPFVGVVGAESVSMWRAPAGGDSVCLLPLPEEVPAVLDAVARGHVPTRSVRSWEDRLASVATARLRLPSRVSTASAATAWITVLDASRSAPPVALLSHEVLACALAGLADPHLRDMVIGYLCPGQAALMGTLPTLLQAARGGDGRQHVATVRGSGPKPDMADASADSFRPCLERLLQLLPLATLGVAPDLLCVIASLAWQDGAGPVARSALDRALLVDPDHRLAQLLAQAVAHGIRLDGAA